MADRSGLEAKFSFQSRGVSSITSLAEDRPSGRKPFQLDHCHAMDTTGETVKQWYPEWYAKKEEKAGA
jgi:hypothetical protein